MQKTYPVNVTMNPGVCWDSPHSNKVLHHELVESFRWMRHIHFALTILEIGLKRVSLRQEALQEII